MDNLDNLINQYTTKSKEEMITLLKTKPGVFYFGIDPTGKSIHLGHLIGINTCIELIKMGWKCIILIGGFTGVIGDPDKMKERSLLGDVEVQNNSSGILNDIKRVLSPYDIIYVNNRDWLDKMTLKEYMMISKHISINKKISLDNFAKRLNTQQPLSMMEFIYPDLQGIDFKYLRDMYGCSLQIGGGDQWGNIAFGVSITNKSGVSPLVFGTNNHDVYEETSKEGNIAFGVEASASSSSISITNKSGVSPLPYIHEEVLGFCTPLLTVKGGKMGKTTNNAVSIYESPLKLIYFLSTLPIETQNQLTLLFSGSGNYIANILNILYHNKDIVNNYINEYHEYMSCIDPKKGRNEWFLKTSQNKISNIIADIFNISKERAKIILSQKCMINNQNISANIKLDNGLYILEVNEYIRTYIEVIII